MTAALDRQTDTAIERDLAYLDAQERQQDAIADRADAMMKPGRECDPFSWDNFGEAIGETLGAGRKSAGGQAMQLIANALLHGNCESAGRQLLVLVESYWTEKATQQARREADPLWGWDWL